MPGYKLGQLLLSGLRSVPSTAELRGFTILSFSCRALTLSHTHTFSFFFQKDIFPFSDDELILLLQLSDLLLKRLLLSFQPFFRHLFFLAYPEKDTKNKQTNAMRQGSGRNSRIRRGGTQGNPFLTTVTVGGSKGAPSCVVFINLYSFFLRSRPPRGSQAGFSGELPSFLC